MAPLSGGPSKQAEPGVQVQWYQAEPAIKAAASHLDPEVQWYQAEPAIKAAAPHLDPEVQWYQAEPAIKAAASKLEAWNSKAKQTQAKRASAMRRVGAAVVALAGRRRPRGSAGSVIATYASIKATSSIVKLGVDVTGCPWAEPVSQLNASALAELARESCQTNAPGGDDDASTQSGASRSRPSSRASASRSSVTASLPGSVDESSEEVGEFQSFVEAKSNISWKSWPASACITESPEMWKIAQMVAEAASFDLQMITSAFQAADKDGDERLSADELIKFFANFGLSVFTASRLYALADPEGYEVARLPGDCVDMSTFMRLCTQLITIAALKS